MDITAVFRDYNIETSSEKESNNASPEFIQTRCIFCEDPSDHLGWHVSGKFVNCWRCGGHSIESALRRLLNLSWGQVNALIRQYEEQGSLSVRMGLNERKKPRAKKIELPGHPLDNQHIRYLERRGFDPEYLAKKYGLLGTGIAGEWKYRIIIPIYFRGRLVSFQGRDITDRQRLRYKSLGIEKSVMHYKHTLYNIDNCTGDCAVVFEGPFDVWRWGVGGVATYSTAITEWQIRLLSRYKRVFFMFDSEPEAQELALKAGRKLASMGVKVEVRDLELERDPAELTDLEVRELRKDLKI